MHTTTKALCEIADRSIDGLLLKYKTRTWGSRTILLLTVELKRDGRNMGRARESTCTLDDEYLDFILTL